MQELQFNFEWNDEKAANNLRKHHVPFSLARTIFNDRRLLTLADADHSQSEERWFSIGSASNGMILSVAYLWTNKDETLGANSIDLRAKSHQIRNASIQRELMKQMPDDMPAEIDFSRATRGLHYIPKQARVFVPVSIEESVWTYFSGKAAQKGVGISDLLSEVLRRDIEISEALK